MDKLVLRRTSSRDSLISLAGSINTKTVYGNFCKDLFESGVTAEMIKGKEKEIHNMIHNMFKPRNATSSSQIEVNSQVEVSSQIIDINTNTGQSQLPKGGNSSDSETLAPLPTVSTENRSRFPRVLPSVDFLAGPSMLDAAKAGNIKRLKSTLGYVRDINFVDDTGATALHHAASGGYNDIVQLLLSKGASIEATYHYNYTPLHRAAQYGYTSTVELLLSKGALIEVVDKNKGTPLHLAAANGRTSTVELLLSKGASIEARSESNYTPLHFAALNGRTSTVELLLAKGASIEARSQFNYTPLHVATLNGDSSTVELLLSKGASIEAMSEFNNTPLQLARQRPYLDTKVVELLERAKVTNS